MLKHIAATLFIACSATTASAQLEFKGIPFGSTIEEFKAAHPAFTCSEDRRYTDRTMCAAGLELCRRQQYGCGPLDFDASKYADEQVDMIIAVFVAGTLERLEVYFKPSAYDGISSALVAKHGKPKSVTKPPYSTTGGVKTTNSVMTWEKGGSEIVISRYGDTLSQGDLFIVSSRYNAASAAREAERNAKRAKGM